MLAVTRIFPMPAPWHLLVDKHEDAFGNKMYNKTGNIKFDLPYLFFNKTNHVIHIFFFL